MLKALMYFITTLIIIAIFVTCLFSLAINTTIFANNNNKIVTVFGEISKAIIGTGKIDSDSYLELEKMYEMKRSITNSELSTVLFSVFSVVILTIGVFFVNTINRSSDKIQERMDDIRIRAETSEANAKENEEKLKELSDSCNDLGYLINKNTDINLETQTISCIQRFQLTLMTYKMKSTSNAPQLCMELMPRIRDQLGSISDNYNRINISVKLPSRYYIQHIIEELAHCLFLCSDFKDLLVNDGESIEYKLNELTKEFFKLETRD